MKTFFPAGGVAINPVANQSARAKHGNHRRGRGVQTKMMQANAANMIRRVLVASITGSLPDDYHEEAIVLLTEALNAPDEEVRGLAVIAMNEIGARPSLILPSLVIALEDRSEMVRKRAARVLGELGTAALPALANLTIGLQDRALAVQLECASSLGRIGPEAEPALPHLFALSLEPDLRVRIVVAAAIRKIGPAASSYSLAMIMDHEPLMRERACELLGQIGCLEDNVVEALLEACTDSEPDVREAARLALDRLQQRTGVESGA
jgi:HEAT repeat protein